MQNRAGHAHDPPKLRGGKENGIQLSPCVFFRFLIGQRYFRDRHNIAVRILNCSPRPSLPLDEWFRWQTDFRTSHVVQQFSLCFVVSHFISAPERVRQEGVDRYSGRFGDQLTLETWRYLRVLCLLIYENECAFQYPVPSVQRPMPRIHLSFLTNFEYFRCG